MLIAYLLAVSSAGHPASVAAVLDRLRGTWELEPIERHGKQALVSKRGFQIRRCEAGRSTIVVHYPALNAPVSID